MKDLKKFEEKCLKDILRKYYIPHLFEKMFKNGCVNESIEIFYSNDVSISMDFEYKIEKPNYKMSYSIRVDSIECFFYDDIEEGIVEKMIKEIERVKKILEERKAKLKEV